MENKVKFPSLYIKKEEAPELSSDNWQFIHEVNCFLKESNKEDKEISAVFVYIKKEIPEPPK